MQVVSPDYAPYTPTRRVDVAIRFMVVDPTAASHATPAAPRREAISNLPQTLDPDMAATEKWATGEVNLWRLDGTWDILPDTIGSIPIGYWTPVSGPQGTYTNAPTITYTLSSPASSAGFELLFDDKAEEWPDTVQLTVYNGNTVLASETYYPTGPRLDIRLPVENYNKVVVAFPKTRVPYRRTRLYHLLFGVVEYLDKSNTARATWQGGMSLAAETFPSQQLIFAFDNSDRRYNFLNPSGIYRFLEDGQTIQSAAVINGEAVDLGTYWFLTAQAKDGALTAEVTATDKVLALEGETYINGNSGAWTVSEALTDVLGGEWTYDTTAEILARQVRRCIPVGTNKREAVRLIAQAAMCAVWVGRDGRLVLRDFSTLGASVDTLTRDELRSMDGITVTEAVDCVVLTVKDEFQNPPVENQFVAGSGPNVWQVSNPLVVPGIGDTVAAWLLAMKQLRMSYKLDTRGNPAIELGDTVTVYNAYGEAGDAVVTALTLEYAGGISERLEGIG